MRLFLALGCAALPAFLAQPARGGETVISSCNPCNAGAPITLEVESSPPALQAAQFVVGERGGPGSTIGAGTLSGPPPAARAVLVIDSLGPGTYRIRADYLEHCPPPGLCPAVVLQTDAITQVVVPAGAGAANAIPALGAWALVALALGVGYAGARASTRRGAG